MQDQTWSRTGTSLSSNSCVLILLGVQWGGSRACNRKCACREKKFLENHPAIFFQPRGPPPAPPRMQMGSWIWNTRALEFFYLGPFLYCSCLYGFTGVGSILVLLFTILWCGAVWGCGGGMPGDVRRYSHVHARPQHSPPPEIPAALPLDPIF